MPKWVFVAGTVVQGDRYSSGLAPDNPYGGSTIKQQAPYFKERGVDISHYFFGTLNVSIRPHVFGMVAEEPTLRDIQWMPGRRLEHFFLSRLWVVFREVAYEGMVYYPDPRTKKGHFQVSHMEIIAVPIPDIAYGDSVTLKLNSREVRILRDFLRDQ